jgi:hypothetical protein
MPDPRHLETAEAALAVAERMLGRRATSSDARAPRQPEPAPPARQRHVTEALLLLDMPLEDFQARGALLEVRVPWLDVTLWFVPTADDVHRLAGEGVHRGRIWTACELMQLLTIPDRTPAAVSTITHAKLAMDGDIIAVRRQPDSDAFMR